MCVCVREREKDICVLTCAVGFLMPPREQQRGSNTEGEREREREMNYTYTDDLMIIIRKDER